jgi:hypothetical protein
MKILLPILPVLAIIAVLVGNDRKVVRFVAVTAIVIAAFAVAGGLIAPHRIAEELVHRSPQSVEWRQGARDTRDAVYQVLPTLLSAFFALVVLALIPTPKK